MVKQFLLKYEQELMEKKIDLIKSFQNNEMSIKENEEYIRFVETSENEDYGSFSPQSYNKKNDLTKIKELKEKQKQLKEMSSQKKEEIDNIDQRLSELSDIIEEVRNDEEHDLIHKIEFCISLVDVDPKRCKLELQEIKKLL